MAELTDERIAQIVQLRKDGMTHGQIAESVRCARGTVIAHLREAGIDGALDKPIEPPIPTQEYVALLASHGETPDSVPYYHQLLSKETLTRHLTRR